jgi:hypothetical protein
LILSRRLRSLRRAPSPERFGASETSILAFDVGLFYNQELSERAFFWGMPFLAASLNF